MNNKYKKEKDEYNRRIYNTKTLPELKIIGKREVCLMLTNIRKVIKTFWWKDS